MSVSTLGIARETFTADRNTAGFYFPGGFLELSAIGTFGSGTLKLQWSLTEAGTYVDFFPDVSLTANGRVQASTPVAPGLFVRASWAGSTGANVTAQISRVQANAV